MKVWHNKPENTFQFQKKIQYTVELFLLLNEQPAPLKSKDVFNQQQVEKTPLCWLTYFVRISVCHWSADKDNINEFLLEALTDKQRAKIRENYVIAV